MTCGDALNTGAESHDTVLPRGPTETENIFPRNRLTEEVFLIFLKGANCEVVRGPQDDLRRCPEHGR